MKSFKVLKVAVLSVSFAIAATFLIGPTLGERMAYAQAKGENRAVREALPGMTQAVQLSQLFRQVAKTVSPAVVEVRVTKKVRVQDPYGGFFEGMPPGMRRRFGTPNQRPREFERRGLGSGVIVDAERGYVLTNNHVVAGADEVSIVLHDGRTFKTTSIQRDPKTDLAVVQIKADNLISAPLGDSSKLEVGDWVLAIGSPEGLEQSVTAGIISAKGRRTKRGEITGQYENYLQTDAAINHGNSGGPLVAMTGEVVGINTAIVTPSGAFAGIGLSIPSNLAKNVMTQLIEKGKVSRGFLGVQFEPLEKGVRIIGMLDESPAAEAGLQVGDTIVKLNGWDVTDDQEFRYRIAGMEPQSKQKLTVLRGGKEVEVTVVLGDQPDNLTQAFGLDGPAGERRPAQVERWGLRVTDMTADLAKQFGYRTKAAGVVVIDVAPGPAKAMGIRPGMMIKQISGKPIETAAQFAEAMDAADEEAGVTVRLMGPGGRGLTVLLTKPGVQ